MTKQEMISRSIYMPSTYWKGIDEVAKNEDLSANQVIRRLISSWLHGIMKIEKDKSPSRVLRFGSKAVRHNKDKKQDARAERQ